MTESDGYALDRSSAETQRLRLQAEIYAPHSAHLLEDEVDIDTMAERVARELKEAGAMFWAPELSGAWARVPW